MLNFQALRWAVTRSHVSAAENQNRISRKHRFNQQPDTFLGLNVVARDATCGALSKVAIGTTILEHFIKKQQQCASRYNLSKCFRNC